jgi:histidinol phosphatase-like PHP family hydrolase
VVHCARKHGVSLVLNTDAHAPGDLVTRDFACLVASGAGLSEDEIGIMFRNAENLVQRKKPVNLLSNQDNFGRNSPA